jgi:hypothetical protein
MSTPKRTKRKPSRTKTARQGWLTAKSADRHELYEKSVQDTGFEVEFLDKVWRKHRGRLARTLREDFCGTFAASAAWVRARKANRAIALDLDRSVLDWGRVRHLAPLTPEQKSRLDVRECDVMRYRGGPVDCVAAWNFSYYLFKTRESLERYFRSVRAGLVKDGLLVLDSYGGHESFSEQEETRDLDGFTYVWHTEKYDPVTGDVLNRIHFRFPDGTELKNAFTYDWRLWTIPELREALANAGFRKVTVWWEGSDADGGGDGIFRPVQHGEACAGWIAYLVAEK